MSADGSEPDTSKSSAISCTRNRQIDASHRHNRLLVQPTSLQSLFNAQPYEPRHYYRPATCRPSDSQLAMRVDFWANRQHIRRPIHAVLCIAG